MTDSTKRPGRQCARFQTFAALPPFFRARISSFIAHQRINVVLRERSASGERGGDALDRGPIFSYQRRGFRAQACQKLCSFVALIIVQLRLAMPQRDDLLRSATRVLQVGRRYGRYFGAFRALMRDYVSSVDDDRFDAVRMFETRNQLPNN